MVCPRCKEGNCASCPELSRQADPTLPAVIKLGSSLCDCQHALCQPLPRQ